MDKYVDIRPHSVHYTGDGDVVYGAKALGAPGMSVEETKEMLKSEFGDGVSFGDESPRTTRDMASTAFSASKWKSPWVPQGDKDRASKPAYNPDMN